jgi:hypothetical protein
MRRCVGARKVEGGQKEAAGSPGGAGIRRRWRLVCGPSRAILQWPVDVSRASKGDRGRRGWAI